MNYIALTGRDMPAMAKAAEILLEEVTLRQMQVAIALYVNSVPMANVLRLRAAPWGIGQLWRIGDDDSHPLLDRLVDYQVPANFRMQHGLRYGLDQFRRLMPDPLLSVSHLEPHHG